ncbi:hypothetical protein [Naasia lichenicola]|uniref:LPXTG cell wall anchor domain-containing protein n=1 Tax=Naasia lichenicola TaxID=2565933 RepID=A0A4S4FIR5_9MICO|nr:hypothetical protein [Naasia lichenicola]THG30149.1 hypothetical protein E6C64_16095 [Naasia lichenicola]
MRGRTVGGLTFAVLVGSGMALAVSAPAIADTCGAAAAVITSADASQFAALDGNNGSSPDNVVDYSEWVLAGGTATCATDTGLVEFTTYPASQPPTTEPTNPEPPVTTEPSAAPSESPSTAPSEAPSEAPTTSAPTQPQASQPATSGGTAGSGSSGASTSNGSTSGSTSGGSTSNSSSSGSTSRTTTTSASGAITTAPVSIAAAVATPPALTEVQTEAASDAIKETRSQLPVSIDPSPVLLSDQASATGSPIVSPNDTGMLAIVVGMSAISIGCAAFSVVLRRRKIGSRHSI